ncbi:MAG: hypothetical protein R2828_35775 [Saprospiraceae bacterium]
MSITINIKSDLEKRLRQRAAAEGFHLDDYIVKMLESQVQSDANSMEEQREIELLQKINMGLSVELWERYLVLKGKREQENLLPEEQEELIAISDRIEEANALRMPYLIELAQLRHIQLPDLLQQLDLQN